MMGPPRVIKVLMGARGAALRAGPFTVWVCGLLSLFRGRPRVLPPPGRMRAKARATRTQKAPRRRTSREALAAPLAGLRAT